MFPELIGPYSLERVEITPKVFLIEVKCSRILRWRDQQVSSSAARLYVLEEELMNKLNFVMKLSSSECELVGG